MPKSASVVTLIEAFKNGCPPSRMKQKITRNNGRVSKSNVVSNVYVRRGRYVGFRDFISQIETQARGSRETAGLGFFRIVLVWNSGHFESSSQRGPSGQMELIPWQPRPAFQNPVSQPIREAQAGGSFDSTSLGCRDPLRA